MHNVPPRTLGVQICSFVAMYSCSHVGSIPVQFETPCNKLKLRMAKGPLRLQAETYTQYKECKPGNCSYAKKRFRIMRFGPVQLKLEELDCITLGDWYDSGTWALVVVMLCTGKETKKRHIVKRQKVKTYCKKEKHRTQRQTHRHRHRPKHRQTQTQTQTQTDNLT